MSHLSQTLRALRGSSVSANSTGKLPQVLTQHTIACSLTAFVLCVGLKPAASVI